MAVLSRSWWTRRGFWRGASFPCTGRLRWSRGRRCGGLSTGSGATSRSSTGRWYAVGSGRPMASWKVCGSSASYLARLKHEFFSTGMAGYERLEQTADAQDLGFLRATLCPLEREAMLEAAGRLAGFYLRTAPSLAIQEQIAYPADLEAVVMAKLEHWCDLRLDARTTED